MTPIFDGTVSLEGKLAPDKSPQFHNHLRGLAGKRVQLTVEKVKRGRSHSQNAYYHGVVVKLIAQHTGHDPEQIHELLKQMFSPKWHLAWSTTPDLKVHNYSSALGPELEPERHEIAVPTSTTRLDTIEFVEYTERCRVWANEFLGLQIPLPGEVTV